MEFNQTNKNAGNVNNGLSKRDVLLLIRELVRDAVVTQTDPDDASGCGTIYLLDQERLMANVEQGLECCDEDAADK